VALLALVLRLGPLVAHGSLGGVLEVDDGVYLFAAQHLVHGALPYRDFLFVQPPGIVEVLAPFAALGRLIGDDHALMAARLALMGAASLSAGLLTFLLRRFGIAASLAAGVLYATWGATVGAERTLLLEPLLNVFLLLALVKLRGRVGRRQALIAGALLGCAIATKLFAVPELVLVAWWLWWRHGRRLALAHLAGAVTAMVVLFGPLFAAAPGAMWRGVIVDQIDRPPTGAPASAAVWAVVVVMVGVAFAATAWQARVELRTPVLWAALATLAVAELASFPSYYYHYSDFAAPGACLVAGIATAVAVRRLARPLVIGAMIGGLGVAAVLGLQSWRGVDGSRAPSPALAAFAAAHRCVWAISPALLYVADAADRSAAFGCAAPVDEYGLFLASVHSTAVRDSPALERSADQFQALLRTQLGACDAAFVLPSVDGQVWSDETKAYFAARFSFVRTADGVEMWARTAP
jgi:hypothetical protein